MHNYWAKKAAASKLPLLQKFWYDKPWARLVALTKQPQEDSSSDEEGGIPFQGKDSPKTHHRKKAIAVQDVEDRLNHARYAGLGSPIFYAIYHAQASVQAINVTCLAVRKLFSTLSSLKGRPHRAYYDISLYQVTAPVARSETLTELHHILHA